MSRPLRRHSSEQLRVLFESNTSNLDILGQLEVELEHRRSAKARSLRSEVQKAIQVVSPGATPARGMDLRAPTAGQLTRPRVQNSSHAGSSESRRQIAPATRPQPPPPPAVASLLATLTPADQVIRQFRIAVEAHIQELKQEQSGQQRLSLHNGACVEESADSWIYRFDFTEAADVFDGVQVFATVGGRTIPATIVRVGGGVLEIAVTTDFGETIPQCVIRFDNTAFLQALHRRLQSIEKGEDVTFRSDLALSVLEDRSTKLPNSTLPSQLFLSLNKKQERFVTCSSEQSLVWLWGPPGTGKTFAISELVMQLSRQGERVLVCSNTNQAVDQMLLKLCESGIQKDKTVFEKLLVEGQILRVGQPTDDLREQFGDTICLDRVCERRSQSLLEAEQSCRQELEILKSAKSGSEGVLQAFATLDEANRDLDQRKRDSERAVNDAELCRRTLTVFTGRSKTLRDELAAFEAAGAIRRMFMRSQATIDSELSAVGSEIQKHSSTLVTLEDHQMSSSNALADAQHRAAESRAAVTGKDRDAATAFVEQANRQMAEINAQITEIEQALEEIEANVIQTAHVVGATVTRTFRRPEELTGFDTVIVDEASMILLPAVYLVAGLAKKRIVIVGDFNQLPPILATSNDQIRDLIGINVFERAGIATPEAFIGESAHHVMLEMQYRMTPQIGQLISELFYRGQLKTIVTHSSGYAEPNPLRQRLTIVDTSQVAPFTSRDLMNSRRNVMHALIVRNLIFHLRDADRLCGEGGRSRVGVCTPYRGQKKLISDILAFHDIRHDQVRVATAHGFQGDERDLMVMDLVDSVGEYTVGKFLKDSAHSPLGEGAKLLNVSLTRAKEGIVLIADQDYLHKKLPSNAALREVLSRFSENGVVVDAREILKLQPIDEDIRRICSPLAVDHSVASNLDSGLFDEQGFDTGSRWDLERAQETIEIYSGFVAPNRVAAIADTLRERIAAGVTVRCVTRPPDGNGSISLTDGFDALHKLEAIGAIVDLRRKIHEKALLIDGKVAWFGSLNPLSFAGHTSEIMVRVADVGFCRKLKSALALKPPQDPSSEEAARVRAENPTCAKCGGWMVFISGRTGKFFACLKGRPTCGWTRNL